MTRLCVPILVNDEADARREIAAAAEAGADLVELRLDRQDDPAVGRRLAAGSPVPVIATCRANWEGGESDLPDEQRAALIEAAAMAQPTGSYLDLELAAAKSAPPLADDRLILSAHDFAGRPERLYNLLSEMNARTAAVNKVAWMARSIRDCQEAFELLHARQRPTIALCMGEAGLISRVLAPKFGAFLSFASLHDTAATAPGQPTVEQLKRLYRWDAIGPATRVFGVVGAPVAHSMSPAVHNAAFDDAGLDAVYVPLLVNPGYESFKAFMETFVAPTSTGPLRLDGVSVTIPHKENALRYLEELGEPSAEVDLLCGAVGAVNTVVVERGPDGSVRLFGRNTDYGAILDCITGGLGTDRAGLAGRRVAVIGAGGTGRTAVAALAACGATVVVYNRSQERAEALADHFHQRGDRVVVAPFEKLCQSCCDIYVNTTSVGMSPRVDESPWGNRPPELTAEHLVFDTVYNPPRTRFLRQAESAGARTVSGIEMFVRQAAAQFERWTGREAPSALMRRVLAERLSSPPG